MALKARLWARTGNSLHGVWSGEYKVFEEGVPGPRSAGCNISGFCRASHTFSWIWHKPQTAVSKHSSWGRVPGITARGEESCVTWPGQWPPRKWKGSALRHVLEARTSQGPCSSWKTYWKCCVHWGKGKRDFQEGQRAGLLLGKGIRAREPDAPGLPTNQDENQGIRASVVHMAPSSALGPDPTKLDLQLRGPYCSNFTLHHEVSGLLSWSMWAWLRNSPYHFWLQQSAPRMTRASYSFPFGPWGSRPGFT